MSDFRRHITVVVAEAEIDHCHDYDDCSCNLDSNQQCFTLDELLNEAWFVDLLKTKGFFTKDEVGVERAYLENFVYEFGADRYSYFTKDIKQINKFTPIKRVYQEIIGVERLKQVAKKNKAYEDYLAKQEEINKKNLEKQEAAKEKRKALRLAKAKQLLEEEGML